MTSRCLIHSLSNRCALFLSPLLSPSSAVLNARTVKRERRNGSAELCALAWNYLGNTKERNECANTRVATFRNRGGRGGGGHYRTLCIRRSKEGGKKWAKLGREKAHVENVLLIDHDNDERRRGEDGTLTEQREKKMARCLLRTKALFRCSGSSHL